MSEYTSYPKLNISIDKIVMQRIINIVRDVCLPKKTGAELYHKPRVLRKRELSKRPLFGVHHRSAVGSYGVLHVLLHESADFHGPFQRTRIIHTRSELV